MDQFIGVAAYLASHREPALTTSPMTTISSDETASVLFAVLAGTV